MRIENWSVTAGRTTSAYDAPEMQTRVLQGRVFGHPRFPEGYLIQTSSIVGKNDKDEVLTFSGSEYELGQVDAEYESRFPGAKERLLDNFRDA